MSADPVVSPADTIRRDFDRLQAQVGAAVGYETSQGPLGRIWRDRAALLAVGERDRAEIERLRGALDEARETLWDFDKTLVAELSIADWKHRLFLLRVKLDSLADSFTAVPKSGERDRRQIARLTEPLKEIAVEVELADDLSVEAQISVLWGVIRRHSKIAADALAAVLADEEDAGNG